MKYFIISAIRLSNINLSTLAFLCLLLHHFQLISMLCLKCVSGKQYIIGVGSFIQLYLFTI